MRRPPGRLLASGVLAVAAFAVLGVTAVVASPASDVAGDTASTRGLLVDVGPLPTIDINPCHTPFFGRACGIASIPGKILGAAADSVAKTVTQWIADGATGILGATLDYAQTSLDPGLSTNSACPGCVSSAQFGELLLRMRALAGAVGVVFLFLVVIQAVLRADAGVIVEGLKRLVLVAMVAVALVWGTAVLMGVADQMTTYVIGDSLQRNAGDFIKNLGASYQTEIEAGTTPLFFIAVSALLTVLVGFLLFIEFAIRTAVVELALLFFPLLLVASIWQPASRAARRLADVLLTAIFSKFVILVTLGLAAALFSDSSSKSLSQGIGEFVVGVVVLLLTVLAPIALLSFVSHAPEAAMSIAGVHRGGGAAVMSGAAQQGKRLTGAGGGSGGGAGAGAGGGAAGGAAGGSTPILTSSQPSSWSGGAASPGGRSGGGGGPSGGGAAGPPGQSGAPGAGGPPGPTTPPPSPAAAGARAASNSGGSTT